MFGSTKDGAEKGSINKCKIALTLYVVLSFLFILFIAFTFFRNAVYGVGFVNGQQQGYQLAIQELMTQVESKCEPVEIRNGEQKVNIINMACLQAPAESDVVETEEG